MGKKLVEKLQEAPLWHIVWVSVIISELLTAAIVAPVSLALHGQVRNDFLLTGAIAAGFVSLVVTGLIVMFVAHIRESHELNKSQRREAEDQNSRLATAVDQAAEGIIITDTEATILYANPSFCHLTGYATGELLGKNANVLYSGPSQKDTVREMWDRILGGNAWCGTYINRKKDGSLFEAKTTVAPILGAGGKTINYVAVLRDETHEKMLAKARDYFTAVTSHELRTPMAKLQLAMILAEEQAAYAHAPGNSNRLTQILGELFAEMNRVVSATTILTALSTNSYRQRMMPTFIYPSVLNCINLAREAVAKEGRDIALVHDLKGLPEGTQVLADRELASRVVEEMVSNAIKYTPDGRGIAVSAALQNGEARITIADQGIGIPPEKTGQVYEPFFSFENPDYHSTGPYKYLGGGIGLGFTIARLIMEHHGGRIQIASAGADKGTTVTLSFPALR